MADAIAISPFTSPLPHQWCKKYHDRHGILSDCPWFLQQKTPFLKFWKTNLPFSNFEKRNSLCRHSPTLLLCSDKDNWCLTPRTDEAKYFLYLCFTEESFFKILKNKTPFIVSAGTPLFLDGVQKTPFSQVQTI